jgi:hypothetical protein
VLIIVGLKQQLKSLMMKPTKECKQIFMAVVALAIIWFVSQAQALTTNGNPGAQTDSIENYSAIGTVSFISTSTDIIDIANGTASDGNTGSDFAFNLDAANNIESTDYTQLSLGDISSGDKIVVQGIEDNGVITITRVIDFTWNGFPITALAATSTDLTATSTPADLIAASTTNSDDNASSTGSTASSTDNIASSTDNTASTTNDNASSTDLTSTSTDSTATSTIDSDDNASSTDNTASSTTDNIASSTDQSTSSSTDNAVPPTDQTLAPISPDASTTGQ